MTTLRKKTKKTKKNHILQRGGEMECVVGNCKNEPGTMIYANGNKYEGEWKDDKRHGKGKLTYVISFNKGYSMYEGEWENDVKRGRGIMNYKYGGMYDGEWLDTRHGQGKMVYDSDSIFKEYIGPWVNDKEHGVNGKITYNDNRTYVGDLEKGKEHGQGKMTFSDGTSYEGIWNKGVLVLDGEQKIIYSNGNIYEGNLRDGKEHGRGTMTYGSHSVNPQGFDNYVGQWSNGYIKGEGTMTYKNDNIYEGQWKIGTTTPLRNGKGKMTYANGDIYQGEWKDDKKHGCGTEYSIKEGKIYEGMWKDDKREGVPCRDDGNKTMSKLGGKKSKKTKRRKKKNTKRKKSKRRRNRK